MILEDYKQIVQDSVDDYSTRAGNVIEQQIKEKYQEILRYTAKWLVGTEQETITASISNRYVSPSEFMQIVDVQWKSTTDTDYTQLDIMDEKDYLKESVNTDVGRPSKWYLNGQKIYFDKTPDNAGSVLVTYIPVQAELIGTQVSVIPNRFTDVLVTGAIAGFKAYERLPDAREYESQFSGSYSRQGRIKGLLGAMIQELSGNKRISKIKFW
jgi:hypothetical protein